MYREIGKKILSKYLSIPSNIEIIESRIFHASSNEKDYYTKMYECVGYLSNSLVKEYHEDIKMQLTGFSLSVYNQFREDEDETDKFIVGEIEVDEGALSCPRCKSNRTFSYTKQVRAADEGTSVFAQCYQCKNKWRES